MKTNKKFLAMLMALIMCFSFNATVFADSEVPAGVERHTITIEVPAAEESSGIQPWIWNNPNFGVTSNSTICSGSFTIPDRYFAYEMNATTVNGPSSSTNYTVAICKTSTQVAISFMGKPANGVTYKNDWITVTAGDEYYFEITNQSNIAITVQLIYYSWA